MMQTAQTLPVRKKILFSLLITVCLFGFLDGLLRISGFSFRPYEQVQAHQNVPEWSQKGVMQDPTLSWSWTPVPGAKFGINVRNEYYSVHFNQKGYRSPDFPLAKPPGTVRIVCMGDSCTMGWGVSEEETFCSRLQVLLQQQSAQKVEVINAGVLGYTSFQGFHQLQSRILKLNPDIVLISYNWNDHLPAIDMGQGRAMPDNALPATNLTGRVAAVLSHLKSYQLLNYLIWKMTSPTRSDPSQQKARQEKLVRVSLPDYENNLQAMIDIARIHHVLPMLMSQPRRTKPPDDPQLKKYAVMHPDYNNAMRDVAHRNKVPFVNLKPAFSTVEDSKLFLDLVHPSPIGHRIIAKEVAAVIESTNLVVPKQ